MNQRVANTCYLCSERRPSQTISKSARRGIGSSPACMRLPRRRHLGFLRRKASKAFRIFKVKNAKEASFRSRCLLCSTRMKKPSGLLQRSPFALLAMPASMSAVHLWQRNSSGERIRNLFLLAHRSWTQCQSTHCLRILFTMPSACSNRQVPNGCSRMSRCSMLTNLRSCWMTTLRKLKSIKFIFGMLCWAGPR